MRKFDVLRLNDLLPDPIENVDEIIKQKIAQEENVGKPRIPGVGWRLIQKRASDSLRKALGFNVYEVFGKAWSQAPELHELSEKSQRQSPEREWTLALGRHPVKAVIHPDLTVDYVDIQVAEITFDLEVEADFRAVVLAVSGRRITAAWAGDCEISACLRYRGAPLHPPVKSGEIELSGRYEFAAPGLAIL
jgi:hypothetical protein